jgi:flagellar basal-body rod protein FlgG
MNDAFYVAATGMAAQQMQVDATSNNLTNVTTPGYKKSRVVFQDLVYRALTQASGTEGNDPVAMGSGVMASAAGKDFTAGDLRKTDGTMDLAVRGNGFLEVVMPDGTSAYTRGGTLKVNKDGLLADNGGHAFKANITVPSDAKNLSIGADGRVTATVGSNKQPTELGRLELVDFSQSGGLSPVGDGLYASSERSGDPIAVKSGSDGAGTLAQGYLENSNVSLIDEMMNLMLAQRSYSMSAKVVQACDEMAQLVNQLRR